MIAAANRFPRIPLSDALAKPDRVRNHRQAEELDGSADLRDLSAQGHLKTPSRLKSDSDVYVSVEPHPVQRN